MSGDREIVGLADGVIRLSPLEQPKGQSKVAIHPGSNGHGAAWVIEALSAVPIEDVGVRLAAVAGQAGRHTVFCNA